MKFISEHFDNHFHEGFKIKEIGIRLSKKQLSYLRMRLQVLVPKTPSCSFTTLTLSKFDHNIIGQIETSGLGQNFTSTAQGQNPEEVFKELEKDMNDQLLSWKKGRFLNRFQNVDFSLKEEVIV